MNPISMPYEHGVLHVCPQRRLSTLEAKVVRRPVIAKRQCNADLPTEDDGNGRNQIRRSKLVLYRAKKRRYQQQCTCFYRYCESYEAGRHQWPPELYQVHHA